MGNNTGSTATIKMVPDALKHDQRIVVGASVEILRKKSFASHIKIGTFEIRGFPNCCLELKV
jgi:hypothetical protein